jgi:signal transduction histidine kinase
VLFRSLVDNARELFDATYAAIGVLDPSGTTIERFQVGGMDAQMRARIGAVPTGRGLLGALLEDPRPVRLERLGDDPRSCGFPPNHPPMESFLGVPILLGGVVFGNLYMTEKRSGTFTPEDEILAQVFAAQAAVAIDNALRFARERGRTATLEELQATIRAVQDVLAEGVRANQALETTLAAVVGQVGALTGADGACVALVEGDHVVIRVAQGTPAMTNANGRRCVASADAVRHLLRDLVEMPVEAVELRVGTDFVGVLAAAGDATSEVGAQAVLQAVASQLTLALVSERAGAASSALDVARERERATAEGFRRAIRAQEAERGRIARELHDEAGQVMMAVALHLRALEKSSDDPQQRADLEELHAIVSEAAAGLHEMISELRPGQLREHGLAAAIDQQAIRTREASGIQIDVHLDALPTLPDEVEIALYRIVQEALVNVVRHSGATAASVTAARTGGGLRLVIEDNGRGFDPSASTRRHGLLGMSERMALLGGHLHVDSSPGVGTTIIAELNVAETTTTASEDRTPP